MNNATPPTSTIFTSEGHFSTNTFRIGGLSHSQKFDQGQVLLLVFRFYKLREGLSGRVLPLHHHRHRTHMSFTAVLGMDVPQHRLSGQCPLVSNVSIEVLELKKKLDQNAGAQADLVALEKVAHDQGFGLIASKAQSVRNTGDMRSHYVDPSSLCFYRVE